MLSRLRADTGADHRKLDQHRLLATLTADPSRDEYRIAMTGLARGWCPLEEALEHSLAGSPWQPWLLPRRDALMADLEDLGATPPVDPAPIPAWSPEEAVGVLYTVKGAQLGSAFLERRLAASDAGLPLAFFRCREDNWPAFCQQLRSLPPAMAPSASRGARFAFRYLLTGLESDSLGHDS
ncbi:biliverdin-producing heme oxygenase [Marinobacter daqiaonensis]|uniref:biliverdin-producing heme oxygenase n=1 Tax=Marinobacter daqiaonensis TaxID=650891 RepID=UPI003877B8BA